VPNSSQQNAFNGAQSTGVGVLYDALGNPAVIGAKMTAGAGAGNVLASDASGNLTLQPVAAASLVSTGTLGESIPRYGQMNSAVSLSSGTLLMTALYLPAGVTVGHLATASGGATFSGPTHWWFALYDNNLVQLATTADQTNTAWASNTYKTLAVATIASGASATFTTTYTGLYYFGVAATWSSTGPNIMGLVQSSAALTTLPPVIAGTSDTGLTTPPSFPHTATAITPGANVTYGQALVLCRPAGGQREHLPGFLRGAGGDGAGVYLAGGHARCRPGPARGLHRERDPDLPAVPGRGHAENPRCPAGRHVRHHSRERLPGRGRNPRRRPVDPRGELRGVPGGR